jgi:DNA-binding NarL/FixJ family response regulator
MRISIVEDHDLFAEALDLSLTLQGHEVRRVALHGEQVSPGPLAATVLRQHPDVVLLDLDLGPGTSGARLVEPLSRAGVAVVVVTATSSPARLGECLDRGARAVVSKSVPLNAILSRIRLIGQGRPVESVEYRERLIACYHRERSRTGDSRERLETLSRREGEVLGSLMNGRTVAEIARAAYVSEATVRTQVKSVRTKLGVCSQLAAVGVALRAHWSPPAPGSGATDHRFG